MEQRYHCCGYPVWIRDLDQDQPHSLIFYKELAPDTYSAINTCPQCNVELTEATLRPIALDTAKTLQTWVSLWPEVRQQIERMITTYEQDEPHFYSYHAAHDILEFEQALYKIADRVARLAGSDAAP